MRGRGDATGARGDDGRVGHPSRLLPIGAEVVVDRHRTPVARHVTVSRIARRLMGGFGSIPGGG